MFISTSGHTILLLAATMGMVLAAGYYLPYAAHSLLVILQDTAAGRDEVVWPDEPFLDWMWKGLFLVIWLIGLVLAPAWFLIAILAPFLRDSPALVIVPVLVGSAWLFFPVCLLSALRAGSFWLIFHFDVLRGLARHPAALLVVYLATGVLLFGGLGLVYLAMTWHMLLILVAAPALATAVLVSARLVGRLSLMITGRPARKRRKERAKTKKETASRAVAAEDPWAIPGEARRGKKKSRKKESPEAARNSPSFLDPWKPPSEAEQAKSAKRGDGYGGREGPQIPGPPPEEGEPDKLHALPPEEVGREVQELKKEHLANLAEVSEFEARLAGHEPDPEIPAKPLWNGVYSFPWYPHSLVPWFRLTFGFLLMEIMLKIMVDNWQF